MLRLYVLRHARSSWTEPGKRDFDRGLDDRGIADLPRIAEAMRDKGYAPDRIRCSPAKRTRLTLRGLLQAFSAPPAVDYIENLYSGGADAYFDCLRDGEATQSQMIIGHNPMCESFCSALAGGGDVRALGELMARFPTGALAVFHIDLPGWPQIAPGSGRLVDFIVPREL